MLQKSKLDQSTGRYKSHLRYGDELGGGRLLDYKA